MAKILFLQDILFEFIGPMQLSAILKKAGYETDILIWNEERNLIEKIKQINPDLIAFSTTTGPHIAALKVARKIREELNIPNIFGGPHPTFFPEIIKESCVDSICVGEGDGALLDLANAIDKNKKITGIKNVWVKQNNKIHKNPVRPLVENLDELPFPDRMIYYKRYKFLKNLPTKRFMSGRGCPYNCSYCFNHAFKKLYDKKGKYIRKKSPDNFINEIREVKEKYPLKTIRFSDDTFTFDYEWLKEFLPKYKQEINLPFNCMVRANELNEEIVGLLSKNCCRSVYFGIESGNEKLRTQILNKNVTDKQIIDAARLLKKYKIKFGTYNMLAIPHETIKTVMDTINMNIKIRPDYPSSSVFHPYPKTEINNYLIERGLILDKDFNKTTLMTDVNNLKLERKKEIINLERFFSLVVKHPTLLPFVKIIAKLPPNRITWLIQRINLGLAKKESYGLGWKDFLIMGKSFLKNV